MTTLSDAEAWTIANALRVAAKQYESDAHDFECKPNYEGMVQQFKDQAKQAIQLAERIEGERAVDIRD